MAHQSMLFVTKVQHGKEADLRRMLNESNMADQLLQQSNINSLKAYVGGGYFVLQFEYEGEDFTRVWNSFVNMQEAQNFQSQLAECVEGGFNLGQSMAPGDMPLAAFAASWPKQQDTGELGGSPMMREKPGNEHLPRKEGIPSSQHAADKNS